MPPDRTQLITESGEVARTILQSNYNANFEWGTVVIGSGMGGGVVASALADEKKSVLVLEAGSLLFPTHIGNLPRRIILIGKFQNHIWSLWYDFAVVFQCYCPLMEENSVTLSTGNPNDHAAPVNVNMQRAQVPDGLLNKARGIAHKIPNMFGAEAVTGEEGNWPDLQVADVSGVAHEVGTLRMPSRRPDGTVEDGVVDKDLKFVGIDNLYACDNSVFPVSLAGNPSLTLVALARRLAKTIAQQRTWNGIDWNIVTVLPYLCLRLYIQRIFRPNSR